MQLCRTGLPREGEDVKLITSEQVRRLANNGKWNATRRRQEQPAADFVPVVKLFCPWCPATWLLTEIHPDHVDVAYGLCDLGFGLPELGRVSLSSLEALRSAQGMAVERDQHFRPATTLAGYALKAHRAGRLLA